jgi:hypothetical protein
MNNQKSRNWTVKLAAPTKATDFVLQLLVTANVIPSSPILVTLTMEAERSTEKSVLTRATRRNISEDGILHSHLSENIKSYTETYRILAIIIMHI